MIVVAPLVGVRIEIKKRTIRIEQNCVAPLVGARIEILRRIYKTGEHQSLPSWERGLKSVRLHREKDRKEVAPLVGARIEILQNF